MMNKGSFLLILCMEIHLNDVTITGTYFHAFLCWLRTQSQTIEDAPLQSSLLFCKNCWSLCPGEVTSLDVYHTTCLQKVAVLLYDFSVLLVHLSVFNRFQKTLTNMDKINAGYRKKTTSKSIYVFTDEHEWAILCICRKTQAVILRLPAGLWGVLNGGGLHRVCLKLTGVPLSTDVSHLELLLGHGPEPLGSAMLWGTPIIIPRTLMCLFLFMAAVTLWDSLPCQTHST